MELTVIRYNSSSNSTLGLLFINNQFACYTLEDAPQAEKIPGKTRIPAGRYKIELRTDGAHHLRYQKKFPVMHQGVLHITNVPNFKWILIHIGNDDEDTAGCLLVGDTSISNVNQSGRVNNSTAAYLRIYPNIVKAFAKGEDVWITYLDKVPGIE